MKRLFLLFCALCFVHCAFTQKYDYDDIYFNPKKDIKKEIVFFQIDIIRTSAKIYSCFMYIFPECCLCQGEKHLFLTCNNPFIYKGMITSFPCSFIIL